MTIWDSAPADIREKGKRLLTNNDDASDVIRYLIGKIEDRQPPQDKSARTDQYDHKWTMSQMLPSRKLVNFCLNKSGLATVVEKTGEVSVKEDWDKFNVVLSLPLPKRVKPQYNLVFSKLGSTQSWLILTTPTISSDLQSYLEKYCKYCDFNATVTQAVPAYTGAQEGVLYFLTDFVFFGFKKPLFLAMIAEIESISFTTVTNHTFNVIVKLLDDQQFEFEKISHDFHSRISEFIEQHNLNDESMAEVRKAKKQKIGPSALESALKQDDSDEPHCGDDEDDNSDEESDETED